METDRYQTGSSNEAVREANELMYFRLGRERHRLEACTRYVQYKYVR